MRHAALRYPAPSAAEGSGYADLLDRGAEHRHHQGPDRLTNHADFFANLGRIYAMADASRGFVWRLQTDAGDATADPAVREREHSDQHVGCVWACNDLLKSHDGTSHPVAVITEEAVASTATDMTVNRRIISLIAGNPSPIPFGRLNWIDCCTFRVSLS